LTAVVSEDGRSGTGGAVVDDGVAAVIVAEGVAVAVGVAAAAAPGLSQGLGGDAIAAEE